MYLKKDTLPISRFSIKCTYINTDFKHKMTCILYDILQIGIFISRYYMNITYIPLFPNTDTLGINNLKPYKINALNVSKTEKFNKNKITQLIHAILN